MKKSNYIKFKNIFDLIISFLLLLILIPVFIILCILVRLFIGSPILFKQNRIGLNEKPFIMIKFRTMTNDMDIHNNLLPDNKRLTKFGKILRLTSLDELPELFNVLKNEMSIIGPRPLLLNYLPYYTQLERSRHNVKPGITGLAQVSGRNYLNWDDRLEQDIKYVQNISLLLDIKILIKTIMIVVFAKNISVNSNTVEPALSDIRKPNSIMNEEK